MYLEVVFFAWVKVYHIIDKLDGIIFMGKVANKCLACILGDNKKENVIFSV